MSGFTMDHETGQKLWHNVFVPVAQSAGRMLYDNSVPIIKEYWAGKVQRGTKKVLKGVDSLFSPETPTTKMFRSSQNQESPDSRKRTFAEASEEAKQQSGVSNASTSTIAVQQPSQFIYGRGAELSFSQQNILAPIKHKTGESSNVVSVNPAVKQMQCYARQTVNHGFAFKMILADPTAYGTAAEEAIIDRFYVHNHFRHNVSRSSNVSNNTKPFSGAQQTWNQSLGPDASFARVIGGTAAIAGDTTAVAGLGAGYITVPANTGLNPAIATPFRYPKNGDHMYSRLNRVWLENLGWNANPMKVMYNTAGASTITPTGAALEVYDNAGKDTSGGYTVSLPSAAPLDSTTALGVGPSFYYRSNTGVGNLTYQFSNDGAGPVCIDIVITRLKRNEKWNTTDPNGKIALEDAYGKGYLNYSLSNQGQFALHGRDPQAADVMTNTRVPFMPAKALKYYKTVTPETGDKTNPFKQVSRDQFIISGGATRSWSMMLQGMDYDARKYYTTDYANDDLSYTVSIACSCVSTPFIESNPTATGVTAATGVLAIVDRRPLGCNVSVVGQYTEHVNPVYLSQVINTTFIDGSLQVPTYYQPAVSGSQINRSIDIANVGQVTRDENLSSAYISLGPTNTQAGA